MPLFLLSIAHGLYSPVAASNAPDAVEDQHVVFVIGGNEQTAIKMITDIETHKLPYNTDNNNYDCSYFNEYITEKLTNKHDNSSNLLCSFMVIISGDKLQGELGQAISLTAALGNVFQTANKLEKFENSISLVITGCAEDRDNDQGDDAASIKEALQDYINTNKGTRAFYYLFNSILRSGKLDEAGDDAPAITIDDNDKIYFFKTSDDNNLKQKIDKKIKENGITVTDMKQAIADVKQQVDADNNTGIWGFLKKFQHVVEVIVLIIAIPLIIGFIWDQFLAPYLKEKQAHI